MQREHGTLYKQNKASNSIFIINHAYWLSILMVVYYDTQVFT
jgi:hypothetical protein